MYVDRVVLIEIREKLDVTVRYAHGMTEDRNLERYKHEKIILKKLSTPSVKKTHRTRRRYTVAN